MDFGILIIFVIVGLFLFAGLVYSLVVSPTSFPSEAIMPNEIMKLTKQDSVSIDSDVVFANLKSLGFQIMELMHQPTPNAGFLVGEYNVKKSSREVQLIQDKLKKMDSLIALFDRQMLLLGRNLPAERQAEAERIQAESRGRTHLWLKEQEAIIDRETKKQEIWEQAQSQVWVNKQMRELDNISEQQKAESAVIMAFENKVHPELGAIRKLQAELDKLIDEREKLKQEKSAGWEDKVKSREQSIDALSLQMTALRQRLND